MPEGPLGTVSSNNITVKVVEEVSERLYGVSGIHCLEVVGMKKITK